MRILTLKIKNFRSYANDNTTEIRFEPGINTIVGKNNSGKSTIFQALLYMKDEISINTTDYFRGLPENIPEIEISVKFSEAEVRLFFQPFIDDAQMLNNIIKMQSETFPDVTYKKNIHGLSIKIGKINIIGATFVDPRFKAGDSLRNLENWGYAIIQALDVFSLEDYLISKFQGFPASNNSVSSISTQVDISSLLYTILKSKLKIFPEFRFRPSGGDERVTESYDGLNVASVLNTLKNGDTNEIRKWRRIQTSFSEFYSTLILDVRKPPRQDPKVWIEKQDIDYDNTIDKLGAGISEFIVFITHLIDSRDSIYCLDNPEVHFHPQAQRKLLKLLTNYSKNNQFLLITHSENLIKTDELHKLILIREIKGHSIINQIKPNIFTKTELVKLDKVLTSDMKEVFFSDFTLLVEGETERGALPIFSNYINKNFDDNNISIISISGKHFEIPIKLCKSLNIAYWVLCDRDALMNIETHYGRGDNRIECSPIIQTLLKLKLLTEDERNIVYGEEVIIKKGNKRRYDTNYFNVLQKIAMKNNIYVLSSKFETILKRAGYQKYFDEMKKQLIRSKPIIGKYIASKIVENNEEIPSQFLEILEKFPSKKTEIVLSI